MTYTVRNIWVNFNDVICGFISEIPDFITCSRYLFTAVAVILIIYVRVTSFAILTYTFYQVNH